MYLNILTPILLTEKICAVRQTENLKSKPILYFNFYKKKKCTTNKS